MVKDVHYRNCDEGKSRRAVLRIKMRFALRPSECKAWSELKRTREVRVWCEILYESDSVNDAVVKFSAFGDEVEFWCA